MTLLGSLRLCHGRSALGFAAERAYCPRCYVAVDCDRAWRTKDGKAAVAAPLPPHPFCRASRSADPRAVFDEPMIRPGCRSLESLVLPPATGPCHHRSALGFAAELAYCPRCYVVADCDRAWRTKDPKVAFAAPPPSVPFCRASSAADPRAAFQMRIRPSLRAFPRDEGRVR
jgi:hypothetical protein